MTMVGGRVLLYLQYDYGGRYVTAVLAVCMVGGRVLLYLQYDYDGR